MNAEPPAPRDTAARPTEVDLPDALERAGGLKRWLKPALNLVAVVFVVLAGRSIAQGWQANAVHVSIGWALAALVPFFFSCFAQAFAWIALIERMAHRRVPRGPALANYLASQLMRYTPGKVGLPLVRMQGADRLGVPRTLAGTSVLIEMVSWTATGAVVGFGLLAVAAPAAGLATMMRFAIPALVASALGLLVLLTVDRKFYPAKVRFLFGAEGTGPVIPYQLPLIQTGYWALVAVHGYLMSVALGAPVDAAVTAMGLYVLSSVMGFVVLAAPAGVGVRESIIISGLTPLVGAAPAAAASIISRAASFVAEVLVWAAVKAVVRDAPRPEPSA
ncbi:MAG TPA: lysylphosphatidylglycerol synthase domain-containing protein [Polyangiaceae bacterium]|nr:lysylphosphatidylglycerol synthase domain-containing protein [Polyangiaceae bacterium]